VFSSLFSITLPNIEKYFPGIHFSKGNYFPANKRDLSKKKKHVRVFIFSLNDENIEIRFEKFTCQINKINELLCVLINTRESLQIYKN
jgi:hypothetical protein